MEEALEELRAGRLILTIDAWQHDGELLELLWQLEFMIKAEPRGAELLDKVVTGKIIPPSTLGVPTDAERKAPAKKKPGELTLED